LSISHPAVIEPLMGLNCTQMAAFEERCLFSDHTVERNLNG